VPRGVAAATSQGPVSGEGHPRSQAAGRHHVYTPRTLAPSTGVALPWRAIRDAARQRVGVGMEVSRQLREPRCPVLRIKEDGSVRREKHQNLITSPWRV